jgi:ABC-type lipoprotein export system ATPase subunit
MNMDRDKGIEGSRDRVSGLNPGILESSNPAVVARGLTRVYRRGAEKIQALKGIDLDIQCGEFTGVVGHSGAGKTTLLNLIGLMDRATEGSLSVLGHDTARRGVRFDALRRKNIGFVFQEFYLMPTLTALENVLLPTMWGRGNEERRTRNEERGTKNEERPKGIRGRAMELLASVGLGQRMTHRPSELSGGEMQRVAVARALVNSPRLLLADEPTGNLDTVTRDGIFNLLLALNRDSGLTVIVATHDLSLESRFTRVIRLEDGNVV